MRRTTLRANQDLKRFDKHKEIKHGTNRFILSLKMLSNQTTYEKEANSTGFLQFYRLAHSKGGMIAEKKYNLTFYCSHSKE